MAESFPQVIVNGTEYRVLRLSRSAFGPRLLLRDEAGRLFGLFERGADASYFFAMPLETSTDERNPLKRVEFFVSDRGVEIAPLRSFGENCCVTTPFRRVRSGISGKR